MKANSRNPIETQGVDRYFTRHMFRRQYFPALFSMVTLAVGDVADALVIGNRMGTIGLAAIALALPLYMVYYVLMHSFGLGGSIRYSGQMAKGKTAEALAGFQGIICVMISAGIGVFFLGSVFRKPLLLLLGVMPENAVLYDAAERYVRLLLFAAPFYMFSAGIGYFMRNSDLEKEAGIGSAAGNILDISLNIVLVLFCDLGVGGAGIATLSGVVLTSTIDLIFLRIRRSALCFLPLRPQFRGTWNCFRAGFSSSISFIWQQIFLLIGNNVLMRLAGETGVAVFDVVQNLGYTAAFLYDAVSQAVQPILSTLQGEYNYSSCRELEKIGLRTGLAAGIIYAMLITVFAPRVCCLFGLGAAEPLYLGTTAIRIFGISTVFAGLNTMFCGFCLARGSEYPAFLGSTLRGAVILIPAALIFSRGGKIWFWVLYPVTEILSLAILLLYLRFRYRIGETLAPERICRAVLRNDPGKISDINGEIEAFCSRWNAASRQLYFVQMTVEEICSAIIIKGFGPENNKGIIQITLVADSEGAFTLHIRDNAAVFDPFSLKNIRSGGNDYDMDINAAGMEVIRTKADNFYCRRYSGFNTMVVTIK